MYGTSETTEADLVIPGTCVERKLLLLLLLLLYRMVQLNFTPEREVL